MSKLNNCIFLDRDGIINLNTGYINSIKKIIWRKGIFKSIKFLKKRKFIICVATNQSGIARGFLTERKLKEIHYYMNNVIFKKTGFKIDNFEYCPFHKDSKITKYKKKSSRRKPSPGMILDYIKKKKLNKKNCIMIGDSNTDIQAAENANIDGYLIYGNKDIFPKIKKIIQEKFD